MNKARHALWSIVIGVLIVIFDQFSKWWALSALSGGGGLKITSWLSFRLVFNRGISWGMLSSENNLTFWLLTGVIMAITLFLFMVAYRELLASRCIFGHVLLVAGSVSNIIDRFVHHAVVDFVAVSYNGWAWPIFNIADCCIVLGVVIVVMMQFID